MRNVSKIIIIDDNPQFTVSSKRIIELTKTFDQVSTFNDPLQAFSYLYYLYEYNIYDEIPNLILLDLNMPVMSGWDFINTFEQLPFESAKLTDIKIITNSYDDFDKIRASHFTVVSDYIQKPLSIDKIVAIYQSSFVNKYLPI